MPNKKENSPKNKSLALTCFKILFGLYFLCTIIITIIQMYATYSKAEENITKEKRLHIRRNLHVDFTPSERRLYYRALLPKIHSSRLYSRALLGQRRLSIDRVLTWRFRYVHFRSVKATSSISEPENLTSQWSYQLHFRK